MLIIVRGNFTLIRKRRKKNSSNVFFSNRTGSSIWKLVFLGYLKLGVKTSGGGNGTEEEQLVYHDDATL